MTPVAQDKDNQAIVTAVIEGLMALKALSRTLATMLGERKPGLFRKRPLLDKSFEKKFDDATNTLVEACRILDGSDIPFSRELAQMLVTAQHSCDTVAQTLHEYLETGHVRTYNAETNSVEEELSAINQVLHVEDLITFLHATEQKTRLYYSEQGFPMPALS